MGTRYLMLVQRESLEARLPRIGRPISEHKIMVEIILVLFRKKTHKVYISVANNSVALRRFWTVWWRCIPKPPCTVVLPN